MSRTLAQPSKRRNSLAATAAITLCLVAIMAGCSSTKNTAVPASDVPDTKVAAAFDLPTMKLCDLFTQAEVEAAFAEAVTIDDGNSGECWWETKTRLKTLVVKRTSAPDTLEGIEQRRSGFDNSSWESVDLGTEGFRGKILPSVDWLIGDQNIEVNIAWSTKGDPLPIVEKLARLADSRIIHP